MPVTMTINGKQYYSSPEEAAQNDQSATLSDKVSNVTLDVASGAYIAADMLVSFTEDTVQSLVGNDDYLGQKTPWSWEKISSQEFSLNNNPATRLADTICTMAYGIVDLLTNHITNDIFNDGLGLEIPYFTPRPETIEEQSAEFFMAATILATPAALKFTKKAFKAADPFDLGAPKPVIPKEEKAAAKETKPAAPENAAEPKPLQDVTPVKDVPAVTNVNVALTQKICELLESDDIQNMLSKTKEKPHPKELQMIGTTLWNNKEIQKLKGQMKKSISDEQFNMIDKAAAKALAGKNHRSVQLFTDWLLVTIDFAYRYPKGKTPHVGDEILPWDVANPKTPPIIKAYIDGTITKQEAVQQISDLLPKTVQRMDPATQQLIDLYPINIDEGAVLNNFASKVITTIATMLEDTPDFYQRVQLLKKATKTDSPSFYFLEDYVLELATIAESERPSLTEGLMKKVSKMEKVIAKASKTFVPVDENLTAVYPMKGLEVYVRTGDNYKYGFNAIFDFRNWDAQWKANDTKISLIPNVGDSLLLDNPKIVAVKDSFKGSGAYCLANCNTFKITEGGEFVRLNYEKYVSDLFNNYEDQFKACIDKIAAEIEE